MLDIDGYRMDKALQTVVDSQAEFSSHIRECARQVGKSNFLIVGEVVGEIPMSYVLWTFLRFHNHVFWCQTWRIVRVV